MPEFIPKEIDWTAGNSWDVMEENQALLDKIDTEAKDKGELLWRYIQEPFADGYAVYQIIKVNKKTARIRWCCGLGDDWVIPYWGEEAAVDLGYVKSKVDQRDNINAFFTANS